MERENRFSLEEKWSFLPKLAAGDSAAGFDESAYPWSHFRELIGLRNDFVHPKHDRFAYYRALSSSTIDSLDWNRIPDSLEVKEKDVVYRQNRIPRDPYAILPDHVDQVRKVVDDMINQLDELLAGRLTEENWLGQDQLTLVYPSGAEISDLPREPTKRPAIRLELVGPLKRTTLEKGYVDPEWQALGDLVYWSWCCRLQAVRLRASLLAEFGAWGMGRKVASERRFSSTSYDEHAIAVAATNLDRALSQAEEYVGDWGIPSETLRALRLLRNIYEHWDELREAFRTGGQADRGAAKRLAEEFPEAEPWSIELEPGGDIKVAGLISLKALKKALRGLEARARWNQRALRREGRHKATEQPGAK
jgi:hypothetical protein